jgi:hypothetical protein
MDDESPNPPMMGTPERGSSLEELMAWHAYHGTLYSFLVSIGYYYWNPAPGDREIERKRGRER